jgi:hypothetical protein
MTSKASKNAPAAPAAPAVTQSAPTVNPAYAEDFKRYMASATTGILASIPFGVQVDPNAIAAAAGNVALSLLQVQTATIKAE